MKKFIIISIILMGAALCATPALAFNASAVTNMQAPYAVIYPRTFDNLIFDFTLTPAKADTLKALSIRNLGTADYYYQIKYMTLWADAGPAGFQGMGVDKEIGNFSFTSTYQSWYLDGLSEPITTSQRFFVSVETFFNITKAGTTIMEIPQLTDVNDNGIFDVGDFGIFMASKDNGPLDQAIDNSNGQSYSTTATDSWGPKLVITNLFDGQVLNQNSLMIQGMARDQGDTYIRDFTIIIDGQSYDVQELDTSYHTWRYDWQNITDGPHIISLAAHDGWGNYTETGAITVRENQQTISTTNSLVAIDKTSILNDGLDKATVIVTLKDMNNQPIANQPITVETSSGVIITIPNNNTGADGKVNFEVRSTSLGVKTLSIKSGTTVIKNLSITVSSPGSIPGVLYGDLIKASGAAVYYYANDGKRYVFPTLKVYQSWYKDFSAVKTITDSQLAMISIGGNVTYKPGVRMVKVDTDPKAYAVDSHGTLRWMKTEALAKALYGDNWATKIDDIPDAFFVNYKMGTDISGTGDFSPLTVSEAATSINADKGL
jgi:hypothetical protein